MQLLIGDISTAFLPHLPKVFFLNSCGPWHLSPGSCARIFVKCDAGWPKPSRAQCHWWPTGRSMACSSWEIQEGAFNRYLLLKKGKVTKWAWCGLHSVCVTVWGDKTVHGLCVKPGLADWSDSVVPGRRYCVIIYQKPENVELSFILGHWNMAMAGRHSSTRLAWIESFCQDMVNLWGFFFYFTVGLSPGLPKYHIHFPSRQHRARCSPGLSAVEWCCCSHSGAHLLPLEHILSTSFHFYHHFCLGTLNKTLFSVSSKRVL